VPDSDFRSLKSNCLYIHAPSPMVLNVTFCEVVLGPTTIFKKAKNEILKEKDFISSASYKYVELSNLHFYDMQLVGGFYYIRKKM